MCSLLIAAKKNKSAKGLILISSVCNYWRNIMRLSENKKLVIKTVNLLSRKRNFNKKFYQSFITSEKIKSIKKSNYVVLDMTKDKKIYIEINDGIVFLYDLYNIHDEYRETLIYTASNDKTVFSCDLVQPYTTYNVCGNDVFEFEENHAEQAFAQIEGEIITASKACLRMRGAA